MRTRRNRTLRTKRRKNRTSRTFRTQRGGSGTGIDGERCEIYWTGQDSCVRGVKCDAPAGSKEGKCVDPKKAAAPAVAPRRPPPHIIRAKNGVNELAAYKALANEPVTPFEELIYTVQKGNPEDLPELLTAANASKPLTPDELTAVLATAIQRGEPYHIQRVNKILPFINVPLNDLKMNEHVKGIILSAAAAIRRKERDHNAKIKLDADFCKELVNGATPLMVAVCTAGGSKEMCDLLIEKGGALIESAFQTDAEGNTLLSQAISHRNFYMANMLVNTVIASIKENPARFKQEGDKLKTAIEAASQQLRLSNYSDMFSVRAQKRMEEIRNELQTIVKILPAPRR